jgi:hypothetical protein
MRSEIARFYDPEEAIVAQSFMRSSGIACELLNNHHASVNPHLRIALGGIQLVTKETEVEFARELLNEIRQSASPDSVGAPSTRQVTTLGRAVWLPFALLMNIPFLPRKVGPRFFFIFTTLCYGLMLLVV